MADDTAYLAERLKAQQDVMEALTLSIESSLADMSTAVADRGVADALASIEQALVDLVTRMGRRGQIDVTPVAEALRALKPTINVQVNPTPVTVEVAAPVVHVMPAPVTAPAKWTISYPTQFGTKTMTIERN